MFDDWSRAGFWRRSWSSTIDSIIIFVPFQLLAAWLFIASAGHVQMASGFTFTRCEPVHSVRDGLTPPPPDGWNAGSECWTGLFGVTTAHSLTFARAAPPFSAQGGAIFSSAQTYLLNAQGERVEAFDLDYLAVPIFLIYFFAMKSLTGQSIGDRATGIRFAEATNKSGPGPALWRLIARYLAMGLGFLPIIAMIGFAVFEYVADFRWHVPKVLFLVCAGIAGAWVLINLILIVLKRDPLYDRICGISVLVD